MVQTEQNIVQLVYAAKTDRKAADALIQQYMGFIRSETVKFIHAAPEDGHEDELSLAMLAFYEAILHYERIRGSFLGYAAQAIRNRLIDHYRTEKRHRRVLSLHQESGEDREEELGDTLADQADAVGELEMREASRKEIEQFSGELSRFGLSLSDVAENCPRQGRSRNFCGSSRKTGGCRSRNWRRKPGPTARPSNATANTWWPSCWRSPTALRLSAAISARSRRRREGRPDEISCNGNPSRLCGPSG